MYVPKEIILYILQFVPPRHVRQQELESFLKKKYQSEIFFMANICKDLCEKIPQLKWKGDYANPSMINFIRSRSTCKTIWSGRVYYNNKDEFSPYYTKGDKLLVVGSYTWIRSYKYDEEIRDACYKVFINRNALPQDPMGFCKLSCVEFFVD